MIIRSLLWSLVVNLLIDNIFIERLGFRPDEFFGRNEVGMMFVFSEFSLKWRSQDFSWKLRSSAIFWHLDQCFWVQSISAGGVKSVWGTALAKFRKNVWHFVNFHQNFLKFFGVQDLTNQVLFSSDHIFWGHLFWLGCFFQKLAVLIYILCRHTKVMNFASLYKCLKHPES